MILNQSDYLLDRTGTIPYIFIRLRVIYMNGLDILLILLITSAVILALRKIHRDRKNGTGCPGCRGNCSSCGMGCPRKEHE